MIGGLRGWLILVFCFTASVFLFPRERRLHNVVKARRSVQVGAWSTHMAGGASASSSRWPRLRSRGRSTQPENAPLARSAASACSYPEVYGGTDQRALAAPSAPQSPGSSTAMPASITLLVAPQSSPAPLAFHACAFGTALTQPPPPLPPPSLCRCCVPAPASTTSSAPTAYSSLSPPLAPALYLTLVALSSPSASSIPPTSSR